MPLTDRLLYELSRRWPDRMAGYHGDPALDQGEAGTESYDLAYARFQFNRKVVNGLGAKVWGLDVLEIGCGHGGICCFVAVAGAKSVTGIDLNTRDLATAEKFLVGLQAHLGTTRRFPVTFLEMATETMTFPDATFDVVIADNVMEHVDDPFAVMRAAHRVLRPGGRFLVPSFSSIYSKDALHLKYGLSLPWTNLFFSEKTIIRALRRIAEHDPKMYEFYPGLAGECERIRDVRRYKDLNDITYPAFRRLARQAGFVVESFSIVPVGYASKVIGKLPMLKRSLLADVMSYGASAVLRKSGAPAS